jgi:uncharacterized protein (UPF0212 family)
MERKVSCTSCGLEFEETSSNALLGEQPCPRCGSAARTVSVILTDNAIGGQTVSVSQVHAEPAEAKGTAYDAAVTTIPAIASLPVDAEVVQAAPWTVNLLGSPADAVYHVSITRMNEDYHFEVYDTDYHMIDSGTGSGDADGVMDAFVAAAIKIEDGPDPSIPNN